MRIGEDNCTCGAAYLARRGRDPEPGVLLHVTNGESAGNTLRRTALGGAVLSWQDVLHEGPVPAVPAGRLRELRARFLSECGWGARRAILESLERRDRLLAQALAERHVVLWFEHDLYDQLQLLQVLARAGESGYDSGRLELVGAGEFLGALTAEQLESLWPLRTPVTEELVALARLGWDAVRAPEPAALEAFLARDTSRLPFLAAALRRLLEELPETRSGLARSERQLLEALGEGARTPAALFAESQSREEAPFAGDAWIWRWLAGLGAGERPLVSLAGGGPLPSPPPLGDARSFGAAELALTAAGREVLAGASDRVELGGVDRWLGGTHLRPGNVWRWDGRVVHPVQA